jgi:hypothetical protein
MPIVPTKDSNKECELSLKPSEYLDMDVVDDVMKEVSKEVEGEGEREEVGLNLCLTAKIY